MTVAVGTSRCDFEPRPHALSPFDGAHGVLSRFDGTHGAPTGLKVGRKGGDK
jgi:hypothetical protein